MSAPERDHLLLRIADLDQSRRRWRALALGVLLLLAGGTAALYSLALWKLKAKAAALREAEAQLHQQRDRDAALPEANQAPGEAARQDRPLSLSVEVVQPEVVAGTTPTFQLTLKNNSERAEKVLDIRRRHDLQDTYYDLEVTKDGKPVDVPRAISDPGPINDDTFLSLPPGGDVTFLLNRFAQALGQLPPGRYQASVRFWQDPYLGHETSYASPAVTFTVRK